jgi:hypothetical protein
MCRTGTTLPQARSRLMRRRPCLGEDIICVINIARLYNCGGSRSWWGSSPDDGYKQSDLSRLLRRATLPGFWDKLVFVIIYTLVNQLNGIQGV